MLNRSLKNRRKTISQGDFASKPVVGWREWVALPKLGIGRIKVKIDTGARTSALHAYDVSVIKRQGREFVRFKVHPIQRMTRKVVDCEAPLKEWRQVTDSGGRRTLRPVISTTLEIGRSLIEIEITLIARDQMGFRMLIGREAIKGAWVVDPARSFIAGTRSVAVRQRAERRGMEEE
jgi:hypothetical protein